MNHPVLGELDELEDGGWGLQLSLPAFQPFYERWYDDGQERPDTRDPDEKQGRFWVHLNRIFHDGPGRHGVTEPPSDAQVAAIEYLKANPERVARAVCQALVDQAPDVFEWDYLREGLSDEMQEKLATPEGMMQTVELQSIMIGVLDQDGMTKVGFSFHSETLEPEHGVCVVMHGDQPVLVGRWDDLMEMERREEDEWEDG